MLHYIMAHSVDVLWKTIEPTGVYATPLSPSEFEPGVIRSCGGDCGDLLRWHVFFCVVVYGLADDSDEDIFFNLQSLLTAFHVIIRPRYGGD